MKNFKHMYVVLVDERQGVSFYKDDDKCLSYQKWYQVLIQFEIVSKPGTLNLNINSISFDYFH